MRCHRCQGLLVGHTFYDLRIKADARYTTTRCINCGHMEDAIVRANRVRASVSTQAPPGGYDRLPSGHGGAPSSSSIVVLKRRN